MNKRDDQSGGASFRDHRDCAILTRALFEQWPGESKPGRIQDYQKDAFLWDETETHHSLYCVRRGQVAILLNDAAGCELIVRVLGPGEPFGELCFCAERTRPRKNCARAVVDSSVLQIDFREFQAYLRRDPAALETFAFTLCERLSDAEGRIEVLSHPAAETRLGRLLLQLAATRGVVSSKRLGEIRLPIGHEELAHMAAMSRPHVSVTMGKLRNKGVLQYHRGTHLTIDVARLSAYLERRSKDRPARKPQPP